MTETLPEVKIGPVNGHVITVGVVMEEYVIGGSKKGKQTVPVYDSRAIEYIVERAKERVFHKFDCPIIIAGERRTGKSTTAVAIARSLNPSFTTNEIAYCLTDFRKILNSLPPADPENGFFPVAILDEAGTDLYHLGYMERIQQEMVKIFQIIGKKRLTMILCLPHRNLLTKDIRESMFLWIQTKTLNGERGFAELREGVSNIWQMELFWKPLMGFCYDELNDSFWNHYETLKDAYIQDFTQREVVGKTHKSQVVTDQRDKLIKMIGRDKKRFPRKKLAEVLDMRVENISRIVNEK
jgi:DNA polymerase III delta prime subunit